MIGGVAVGLGGRAVRVGRCVAVEVAVAVGVGVTVAVGSGVAVAVTNSGVGANDGLALLSAWIDLSISPGANTSNNPLAITKAWFSPTSSVAFLRSRATIELSPNTAPLSWLISIAAPSLSPNATNPG